MHWAIAAVLVFVGCCSNLIFLEYLVRDHPGSGTIITFSHFLFIAVEGFIFTSKFGTVSPAIPIKEYVIMVLMFFVVQLGNNLSFACNISVPLHTIFRSGVMVAELWYCCLLWAAHSAVNSGTRTDSCDPKWLICGWKIGPPREN